MIATSTPTSRAEIAQLSRTADALLILERPASMRGHELLAGAKLFGYLQLGKPIIGVLPVCEARKVLERVGVSTIADVDSVTEITAVFQQLLHAWAKGTLSYFSPDRNGCQAYSAERQTAALVRVLEGLPPAESFVPGSIEVPASLRDEIGATGWIAISN
jgi:hypothetical protein